jgi:hypothetical protein
MGDKVGLVLIVVVLVAITFAVEYIKDTIKEQKNKK